MINDKLPIRHFYPLYKAAMTIGNGCDIEDIIHYCSISGNQLLVRLPHNTDAIFVSPEPLDALSFTVLDSERRLIGLPGYECGAHVNINNFYIDDGLYIYNDATVWGLWAIQNEDVCILNHNNTNFELTFFDVLTPFEEMEKNDFESYCLNKFKISSCTYKEMYIETKHTIKKPSEDIFILPEAVKLIINNPSFDVCRLIKYDGHNENMNNKKQRSEKHMERHAKTREYQLACILNAVFNILKNKSEDYPTEMNERVETLLSAEWLYNYINNHNAIYGAKENSGVLSTRVRDIIRDVKHPPSEWEVIGGTKSKK
ncbi:hypothetical protein AA471_17580 [Salmonella enterica subsp. enterica]|nr:hypothetical protein [Salmonella enterica subsp. enterica]ECI0979633.1 hypothetical protein [Salmonella enterica subsp. enterica serovar Newport]ECO1010815.1 hypothetical protein [Salmonella enterica subsp. enterica serovar Newport]EDQ2989516.1 hypothetical protein [Salmonella enterica subsp. enterica]